MPDVSYLLLSDPQGALLFFIAGIIFVWVVYFSFILFTSRPWANREVYYPYLAYSVSIILWILSNAYFQSPFLILFSESAAVNMALFANIVSFCAFISAYRFSCRLISKRPNSSLSIRQNIFCSLASLYTLIVNYLPGLTVKHVDIVAPGDFVIAFGPQTSLFFLCLMSLLVLTFYNFLIYKKSGSQLTQIKSQYMILGVVIFMLSTLVVQLIIPFILEDFSLTWLPPTLAIFETLLIGYALLFNRFYSSRYLVSQCVSYVTNLSLYLLPYLFFTVFRWEHNPLLIGLWIVLIGIGWQSSLSRIKLLTSRLFYGKKGNPYENIQQVIGHFQHSTERGLGKLNELLDTRRGQILKINTHSDLVALKSYFDNENSVLVKDELEFQIQYETHSELSNISRLKKNMDASNSALVLPIVNQNGEISHLFMVSKKQGDGLFTREEIDALQSLFEHANQYIYSEEKVRKSQVLAGSIAHEIRNPLSKIQYHFERIDADLFNVSGDSAHPFISDQMKVLYKELTESKKAIQLGTKFIDLIIDEIKDSSINPQTFTPYSASCLTQQALNEYGFSEDTHLTRVTTNTTHDFQFLGSDTLFSFVLFNLIKNAVYYFPQYPQSMLNIHFEQRGSKNRIIVTDTGPGIADNVMPHIFDEFYTSGKSNGSGLGLAYCRRVMNAFGGDILCESEYGAYTRFILIFPVIEKDKIPEDLLNELRETLTGKRCLLIGTKNNITAASSVLSGCHVTVLTCKNGKEAVKYIAHNDVDFAFYDLSLPRIHFEALKQIHTGDFGAKAQKIPLIALSNEETTDTLFDTHVFQGVLRISDIPPVLYRSLNRLVINGSLKPLGNLIGKRVLVVDDMQVNRLLVKSYLVKEGITVLQAENGHAALTVVEQKHPDLILMDIHMPGMGGLEAALCLRKRSITTPIIALSGEYGDDIANKIAHCMNDHLVKPITQQQLIQKIQYWMPKSNINTVVKLEEETT